MSSLLAGSLGPLAGTEILIGPALVRCPAVVQSDMTKGAESSTNMAALGRGLWRKGGGTLVSQVDTPHHHCHHHQIMSVLLSSVLRLLFLPGFFLLLDGGHLRPPSHGGEAWRGQSWPPFPGVHCRLWARLPPSLSPKLSSVSVARATGAQLVSKCQAAGLGSDAGGCFWIPRFLLERGVDSSR